MSCKCQDTGAKRCRWEHPSDTIAYLLRAEPRKDRKRTNAALTSITRSHVASLRPTAEPEKGSHTMNTTTTKPIPPCPTYTTAFVTPDVIFRGPGKTVTDAMKARAKELTVEVVDNLRRNQERRVRAVEGVDIKSLMRVAHVGRSWAI